MQIQNKDKAVLTEILSEISFIEQSLVGLGREMFMDDDSPIKRAVIFTLICIGEYAKLLSEEFRETVIDMPYKQFKEFRHIITENFSLNFNFVWDIVKNDIPIIKSKIEMLLK